MVSNLHYIVVDYMGDPYKRHHNIDYPFSLIFLPIRYKHYYYYYYLFLYELVVQLLI